MCINFNYCIQRSWSMFVQKQLLVHVLYINIYASSTCMLLYMEREYIGIIGQHWTQAIIGYVDKFTNWTFLTYSEKHKSSGKHQVILFLLGDAILYLVYYWQVAHKPCTVKLDNLHSSWLLHIYTVRWEDYHTSTIKLLQGGYIAVLKTSLLYTNVNTFYSTLNTILNI